MSSVVLGQSSPPFPSSLQLVPVTRIDSQKTNGREEEEMKRKRKKISNGAGADGKTFTMKLGRFTNTAIPTFNGAGWCWYQHRHIAQAIATSNGWSEETATLQLFAHLEGESLDVALLLPKETREIWMGLVDGFSAYYSSPGRLAVFRRRFESAFRRPGIDPATFATELGILTLRGFADMNKRRDKFIAGQQ